MPVVANVNFLAGTKAPRHAQQMLQILSVYVRMRHKGFWGKRVTCFRFHANCCPQECPPQTGKEKEGSGGHEVKQTGRKRAAPCASPTFADLKVTGEILAAAVIRCRAELCLTDDSTLEDNVLRLLQTSNKSCAIFLFQPQPRQSCINGLIWVFESFSGTPSHTLAELRAGLYDRLEANTTVIRIFELLHIFRVRQDSAVAAVSFLSLT